ncbi:MAG: 3-isopropylmalate dehydratase, partial [Pseudomonadota bacterium]
MEGAGRAWVFGDNIDTDVLAPGFLMKLPAEELAKHCLEAVDPDFARNVAPGDVVVGGENFGLGSSREQAAISLKVLGVRAVLAKSFARIFYRNAINIGLPALFFPDVDEITAGDRIVVDAGAGRIVNGVTDKTYSVAPIPDHLMHVIAAGGLMPHLKTRFATQCSEA